MIVRRIIVGLAALLLATQVVRIAAVRAFSALAPARAERIWASHPDVAIASGMTAIATAAREHDPVDPDVLRNLFAISGRAPLRPEPFLVRGVQAQLAGDETAAKQAFLAARWRDGRSLPARYFLADAYVREGDAHRGLKEVAALARLSPSGITSLAPYVAAYARDRANWPDVRAIFRSEPALEDSSLTALSADAANADAVLALASPGRSDADSAWLQPLLKTLVDAGQYLKARAIWARVAGVKLDPALPLFDPGFAEDAAPPPFNWALTSSAIGLAERMSGGGLHVIFYGRDNGVLARQLLVLSPGAYRLGTQVRSAPSGPEALEWEIRCVGSADPSSAQSVPVRGGTFSVSPGCPAQWLELAGSSADLPEQSEITLRSIRIEREGSHG